MKCIKVNDSFMTIGEVAADLRSLGIKVSEKRLSDGIASGIYSFGKVLNVGETGRRTLQIFRSDYERWKENSLLGNEDPKEKYTPISHDDWELLSSNTFTQESKGIMWEVIIRSWTKCGGNSTSD